MTQTMRSDGTHAIQLRSGDKVGIVAGSGRLPIDIAETLVSAGHQPFVVMMQGEASSSLSVHEHAYLALENVAGMSGLLRRHCVTHAVLAGGISRRPQLLALKPSLALLRLLPRAVAALAKGDDGALKIIVGMLEADGIKVVGAHQIVPELLAPRGAMTKQAPLKSDLADLQAAFAAARAIGNLDIGQAAIAIGGRVVALEGVEGTHGLLERMKGLRGHGRIAGKKRGVLVKCAKPGQELRADLPAIGPDTVTAAHAAGLAGIGVEAERSLVLDCASMVENADRLGLFVVGLSHDGTP